MALPLRAYALFLPALALPLPLLAQGGQSQKLDASIAVRFGTPGLGIEVNKLLTNHFGLRAGLNHLNFSPTTTRTDIKYDASIKLKAFTGLLDFYPGSRGSFHLSGGVMTNPMTVTAVAQPSAAGTITINDHQYTSAQVGTLTAGAKFAGALPYFGLGFGTPARGGRVAFLFDIGAGIGKSKLTLSATGSSPGLAADLAAQQAETQHDIDKFLKVFPVVSLGLAIRL